MKKIVGFGFVILATVVACSSDPQKPAETPRLDPSATAMPAPPVSATAASTGSASEKPTLPKPNAAVWEGKDRPKTWTDARAVAALAEDCSFVPPKIKTDGMFVPADLLTCSLSWSQSCMPDPCSPYRTACETTCTTGCKDCGTTCASSCQSCRGDCKDEACKQACASKCADCKETCSRTLDRCASGTCNKAEASCSANLKASWKTNGCESKCAGFEKCNSACKPGDEGCRDKCNKSLGNTYDTCKSKCKDDDSLCSAKCLETSGCSVQLCWMHP